MECHKLVYNLVGDPTINLGLRNHLMRGANYLPEIKQQASFGQLCVHGFLRRPELEVAYNRFHELYPEFGLPYYYPEQVPPTDPAACWPPLPAAASAAPSELALPAAAPHLPAAAPPLIARSSIAAFARSLSVWLAALLRRWPPAVGRQQRRQQRQRRHRTC